MFVRFGDVSAVRTTSMGNFDHPGEPAAYWAATRASAEAHANHLMRADKKALIHMDVPESVLASGTAGVHNYGPEASAQWQEVSLRFLHIPCLLPLCLGIVLFSYMLLTNDNNREFATSGPLTRDSHER